MEVSGHRRLLNLLSSTLRLGSEEDTNLPCHPCDLEGKREEASGYCQNCRENLCSQCIAKHTRAAHLRNHVVDRTAPRAGGIASDVLPKCASHENEEVKLYCRAHGTLGCVICMTLTHKQCEIDYIPEVSENFVKSEEYLTYERYIENLKESCALNIVKIDVGISSVRETCSGILKSIKSTKKEIIESLDTFEKELEEKVSEYSNKNMIAMNYLKTEYQSLISEVEAMESETRRLKKDEKLNSLYCEIKKAMTKVQEYQSRTYDLTTKFSIPECKFLESTELRKVLTKEHMFGSIEINDIELGPCNSTEVVERQPDGSINIRADDDKSTCYATGLAFLSPDQLAVADKANKCVKIVDVTYDKMISRLILSSSPRDITVIPPDQLAVTLRDEKIIQFLSTASGLTKTDRIKTDGKCRGIEYSNETLIVTFDNIMSDIQILNLRGQILQRFKEDQTGKILVTEPKCVAVSPNLKHIYVTDFMTMTILRLTPFGHVTGSYKLSDFLGIVVSSGGSVFACAKRRDSVLQLSDDLSKVTIALDEEEGMKGPIGLAYSRAKNLLYVSCGKGGEVTCDRLHTFKLK